MAMFHIDVTLPHHCGTFSLHVVPCLSWNPLRGRPALGTRRAYLGWQQPSVLKNQTVKKNVVDWGMYTYIYTHTYLYLIYIEREIHGGIDWDWYVMMS